MSHNKTFQLLERFICHGLYTITGKYQEHSPILPIIVNMAVLRIVMIVRTPESGKRFLRFLGHVGTRLKGHTKRKKNQTNSEPQERISEPQNFMQTFTVVMVDPDRP